MTNKNDVPVEDDYFNALRVSSVSESIVEKPTIETYEPKTDRKENRAPIIEDWVSDSDEENMPKVETVKMFNKPSFAKINLMVSGQSTARFEGQKGVIDVDALGT
ncbi:hypothetical protein Tco_1111895 [Tanacetum coccineum]|uniref:Uncharacterized protein n=1 Tax=Tanacetum coccineum TaxID=301880 RepID=A0ABQ5IMX8_9ASTR